jgi:hypothetical protein
MFDGVYVITIYSNLLNFNPCNNFTSYNFTSYNFTTADFTTLNINDTTYSACFTLIFLPTTYVLFTFIILRYRQKLK